ncbi:sugar transporter SWEET1 [Hetaerina americana]|uniref:sugar transporter SWEET1 n=1 Tax=Hetaerina americana TaxID=62018 RepID=UPI003A7F6167
MPFEEYRDIVGTVASITTIGQFFSGIFICRDIARKGNTEDVPITPFLGGVVVGSLNLKYGYLLQDPAMIQVNIFAILLNIAYVFVYYLYTASKNEVTMQIIKAIGFVALLLGYAQVESPALIEFRFGVIVTILMMVLLASPLFSLGTVIKTKSTATLPFPLILSGSVVTFLWLLYGIIIENAFLLFQNIMGLTLLLAQLSLFVIYPRTPAPIKKD